MDYEDLDEQYAYAAPYWSSAPPAPPSAARLGTFGDPLLKVGGSGLSDWKSSLSKSGSGSGSGSSEDEEMDPSTKLSKDDLAFLDNLDPLAIADYLENEGRPVEQLTLSLKLTKAVQIITNRAAQSADEFDVVFEKTAVSKLLELLASALSQAANLPQSYLHADAGAKKKKESQEVDLLRARLGLPSRSEKTALSTDAGLPSSSEVVPPPVTPAYADLSALFVENTKLAAAALRPEAVFDPISQAKESKKTEVKDEKPTTPFQDEPGPIQPAAPCYIDRLPVEILRLIFDYAHEFSISPAQRTPPTDIYGDGLGKNAFSAALLLDSTLYRARPLQGSKPAALRFALGLSTVCKSWIKPARSVAFRYLHIHHGLGLVKLNKLLAEEAIGMDVGSQIKSLDVLLPITHDDEDDLADHFGGAPPGSRRGRRAPPRRNYGAVGTNGGAEEEEDEKEQDAGKAFAGIVGKATNLQGLTLRIVELDGGYIAGSSPYPDFLETTIFRTLTSASSLRKLELQFTVDFEEFEEIVAAMPDLETLKVESLENIAGSTQVASTAPNPAKKLRVVHIGNLRRPTASSLSGNQLTWLLEPSVDSGTLRDLSVCLVSQGAGPGAVFLGVFGGAGGGGSAPPFAYASFASLLARCSSLEKLVLYDMSLAGSKDPSLGPPPHNDSLDHALSNLASLKDLSLHWEYTGAALLDSISPLSSLKNLSLYGVPSNTPSASFADSLETGFPALETLNLAGGVTGGIINAARGFGMPGGAQAGGNGGWTGSGIRKIKEVAERRGIKAVISRD